MYVNYKQGYYYAMTTANSYLRWIVDGGQSIVVDEYVRPDGGHRPE